MTLSVKDVSWAIDLYSLTSHTPCGLLEWDLDPKWRRDPFQSLDYSKERERIKQMKSRFFHAPHLGEIISLIFEAAAFKKGSWSDAMAALDSLGIVKRKRMEFHVNDTCQDDLVNTPDKPRFIWNNISASYLKNDTSSDLIRRLLSWGELLIRKHLPTVIQDLGNCSSNEVKSDVCFDYVSRKIGSPVGLDPHALIDQGYEVAAIPQKNDVIFYFDSTKERFRHIGLVSTVQNGAVWIESKWGMGNCYQHLEEVVPHHYGNSVVYLRKQGLRI